jgi:hypothetical protein
MANNNKQLIGQHNFSDKDVSFQFASDEGVCLSFCDSDSDTDDSLSGILDKRDIIAMAQRLGIVAKDLLVP